MVWQNRILYPGRRGHFPGDANYALPVSRILETCVVNGALFPARCGIAGTSEGHHGHKRSVDCSSRHIIAAILSGAKRNLIP